MGAQTAGAGQTLRLQDLPRLVLGAAHTCLSWSWGARTLTPAGAARPGPSHPRPQSKNVHSKGETPGT